MAKEIQPELPWEEIDPMEPLQKATETEAGVDELSATQSAETVAAAQGVDKQNAIASLDHLKKNEDFSKALKKAYSNVEDEYLSGMPQSIWNAYKSGEFGNIKKHEAKDENGETIYKKDKEGNNVLDKNGKPIPVMEYDDPDAAKKARSTRSYFAWNAIGNALANVANKTNNSSDWDKVKTTNLEKALERRNKLKEDQMNTMTDKLKAIAGNDTEMMKAVDMFRNNEQFASIIADHQNENDVVRAFDALKTVGEKVGGMNDQQKTDLMAAMLLTGKGDLKSAAGLLLSTEGGKELAQQIIQTCSGMAGALGSLAGALNNGTGGIPNPWDKNKPTTTRDGETVTKANATDADGKATDAVKKLDPKEFRNKLGDAVALQTLKAEIPTATDVVLKKWENNWGALDFNNFVAQYKPFVEELDKINEEVKAAKKAWENETDSKEKKNLKKEWEKLEKKQKDLDKKRDDWLNGKIK